MRNLALYFTILTSLTLLGSCRGEEAIVPSTSTNVGQGTQSDVAGFFLLNEGNMGSNNATLDYYDYESGIYQKNIFGERNPQVALELGDVGNDLRSWGSRLYALVSNSNLVEVMELGSARHIGQIWIPSPRYIAFKGGYAYVSSYAGAVKDKTKCLGSVAKIDTASLEVVATCSVGYQPEQLVVVGERLYVANSGGYNAPDYDTTLSVVDLESFTQTKQIEVAINLHHLELDSNDMLWISSRGNTLDIGSQTYLLDTKNDTVVERFETLSNSAMAIAGDSLYVCSDEWSSVSQTSTSSYAIVNTQSRRIVTRNFITDGTEKEIARPYSVAVNPLTREFFVADAKNYTSSGRIHCYSSEGVLKWSAQTGEIPSAIEFTTTKLSEFKK